MRLTLARIDAKSKFGLEEGGGSRDEIWAHQSFEVADGLGCAFCQSIARELRNIIIFMITFVIIAPSLNTNTSSSSSRAS